MQCKHNPKSKGTKGGKARELKRAGLTGVFTITIRAHIKVGKGVQNVIYAVTIHIVKRTMQKMVYVWEPKKLKERKQIC